MRSISNVTYCTANALKVSSTGNLRMSFLEQLTSSCPGISKVGPLFPPEEIQFGAQKSPSIRKDHSRFSFSVRRRQNFVKKKNWCIPNVFPNRWSASRCRSVAYVIFPRKFTEKIILLFSDLGHCV